jgi:O-antigen ligase
MLSIRNYNKWRPKGIGFFSAIAFLLLVIFNKAVYKIRFLEWGAGLFITIVILFFIFLRGKIVKKEFYVIVFPLLWIGYALLITPFVYDQYHHLSTLGQCLSITLVTVFIVIALFSYPRLRCQTVLFTVTTWTMLNFIFFLLWLGGYYVYEKGDFSGLFNNRNEFSVETVILVCLLLTFVYKHRILKLILIFVNFIMIVFSLSITGFLFFFFVIFYPFFLKVSRIKKIFTIMSGIITIGVMVFLLPGIQARLIKFLLVFTDRSSLAESSSAFERSWLIIEGFNKILKHPLQGIGIGNSKFVLIPPHFQIRNASVGTYSHNNWIEMGLNAGLPGFFLFYFPIIYIFKKVKKGNKYWSAIKTFSLLFLLSGVSIVQYNMFICILNYVLIVFLYFNKKDTFFEKNIIHS